MGVSCLCHEKERKKKKIKGKDEEGKEGDIEVKKNDISIIFKDSDQDKYNLPSYNDSIDVQDKHASGDNIKKDNNKEDKKILDVNINQDNKNNNQILDGTKDE